MLKRIGEITLPWGTPYLKWAGSDKMKELPGKVIFVWLMRCWRKFVTHLVIVVGQLYWMSLLIRIWWSTLSYAALMSSSTASVACLWLEWMWVWMELTRLRIVWAVDVLDLNPYCDLLMILLDITQSVIRLVIIRSRSFPKVVEG